jgi:glycosyltransferase involved in cell wall biosynthesis
LKLVATRRVNVPISNNILSRLKYKSRLLRAIVAISEATRKLMLADGIPPSKIHKIPSGVDLERFKGIMPPEDFRAKWSVPQRAILVGTIAALVPPKDYPNFINAAFLAAQRNPSLHFMIVGDGELMPKMQGMARDLGLEGRLTFCGFQSDIGIFLQAFDIFVMASRREGLGTAVLDAMSVGLPVIGTRAGGISETIVEGESGLLVEVKNSQALASAILRLAGDESLRKSLGYGALERVKAFRKEQMVEANIRLYESL